MPNGWHTRGRTGNVPVRCPISDVGSTTKPIVASNASSGAIFKVYGEESVTNPTLL